MSALSDLLKSGELCQSDADLVQAAMDADEAELRERANNKAEACCNYHLLRAAQYLAGAGKEGE